MPLRVADFFCGGGGFSEGFRQAGFNIVFAVDKWLPAVNTYRGNKPDVHVIQDDVIRISKLPDEEFDALVPDTEVIIGSPPCQSFSHSNRSGNGDKKIGIQLFKAYLRIVARKMFKQDSILRYWILENVPGIQNYINEEYTAAELGLEGNFVLHTHCAASGKYNAKYYGAPTNRERYLCGNFPAPERVRDDANVTTLGEVLESLGDPLNEDNDLVQDINNPGFTLHRDAITDHHYLYELAEFEYETSRRLKQDKGYMGRMAFPENLAKPARTVMATMTASAREAMILGYGEGRYRLPTVREAACMMSFPLDYWFYGESKGVKHTLVGNAVPPKLSYALARAIAIAENETIPDHYIPIIHPENAEFINLNGVHYDIKVEQPKREKAKFKYHIPYLIINAYRVELTNYKSNFDMSVFKWDSEIHFSQGKSKAKVFTPCVIKSIFPDALCVKMDAFIQEVSRKMPTTHEQLQRVYCMTTERRAQEGMYGPYELLGSIRHFLDVNIPKELLAKKVNKQNDDEIPIAILAGYYIMSSIICRMR